MMYVCLRVSVSVSAYLSVYGKHGLGLLYGYRHTERERERRGGGRRKKRKNKRKAEDGRKVISEK